MLTPCAKAAVGADASMVPNIATGTNERRV
jgi:hypothetical protein